LSGADASFLTKLIAEERDARNFVASFLHHQISTPEMTYEEIEAWPEDDLRRAARSFAEAPVAGFGKNIPSNNDVYESFRVLAVQYQDEIRQSIRKTFSAFSTNYIEKMNPMLGSQQAISAIVRAASGYDVSKYDFNALTSGIVKIPALQNELPRLSQNIIPNVSGAIEAAAGLIAQASSQSMLDQITALSTSVASAMKATDAEMYRSLNLFKPIDLQSLIPKLPNFTETFRRLAKARDGAIALEQAGFGYTEELGRCSFSLSYQPSTIRIVLWKSLVRFGPLPRAWDSRPSFKGCLRSHLFSPNGGLRYKKDSKTIKGADISHRSQCSCRK
jgi:hypothetical protein